MTKYQVFISSTYEDMKEERQAAMSAIVNAGHIPAGMEYFSARYLEQFEVIKNWISMCDIFLLILGGRYGSICEETGKSFVQMEFEYANRIGKPIIAVVIHGDLLGRKKAAAYQANKGGIYDKDRTDLYDKLVAEIKKMRGTYQSLEGLELSIINALKSIESDPDCILNGWVPRLSQDDQEAEDIIMKKETVEHFLRHFLYSLPFEEVTERMYAGRGHSISDIRDLHIGEWDYYTPAEADITYQKLSDIPQTIVDDHLLNVEGNCDKILEDAKLHFKDSLESFSMQIRHDIPQSREPDSTPVIKEQEHYLGRYVAKRVSARITYRNLQVEINFPQ